MSKVHMKAGEMASLELTVRNHPGVMSQVCGLFARRACNVEGIACLPVEDGETSKIWLLIPQDDRLSQMVRQAEKLEDVLAVVNHGADGDFFLRLGRIFE